MAQPIDHLDGHLHARLKKGRTARDALLKQLNAPPWLLGNVRDTELGEASPAVVYVAQALASPLGVGEAFLPELIALVWEGYGVDARFTLEVPRFLRTVDFCVRTCAPITLDFLKHPKAATLMREAPALRDESSFYALLLAVTDAAALIGDARKFEGQARNLDEALRVRATGFGVVAIRHAKATIEADFQPSTAVPEMRALYHRLLPLVAGARSVPGQQDTVDRAALDLLKDVIKMEPSIFATELSKLDALWAKNQPKTN